MMTSRNVSCRVEPRWLPQQQGQIAMPMQPGCMAILRVFLIIFLLLISSGCMAQEIRVAVIVLNYTDHEIGKVHINGHRIVGYFPAAEQDGPGGAARAHSGFMVGAGAATVKWTIGGKVGEPLAGETRTAEGSIPEPPVMPESRPFIYLVLHIYPDDTVKFTYSYDIP